MFGDTDDTLSTFYRTGVSRIIHTIELFRNRVIGTVTLTALLVAIFQGEMLMAEFLDYSSVRKMLDALSGEAKILLTVVLGPFIHQGSSHLVGNLGVLLIAGGYLEYQYSSKPLYLFYLIVGYIAALAPLTIGFVGAVGASGVTYGLTAWLLVHSLGRGLEMVYDRDFDIRATHFAVFVLGWVQIDDLATVLSGSSIGAGDITHIVGALLGLTWAIKVVTEFHEISFPQLAPLLIEK